MTTRDKSRSQGPWNVDHDLAVVEVGEGARAELLRWAEQDGSPTDDIETTLLSARAAFSTLPAPAAHTIRDFATHNDAPGTVLVRGLPIDRWLPPTPADGRPSPDKSSSVSERVLLGLAQLIGEPVGYLTEKEGRLIHDVAAVRGGQSSQTNQSCAVFLNYHNDITYDDSGTYHVTNPDFLLLLCLRASPDGRGCTAYADARAVLAELDEDVVEVLRRRLFRLNAPGTYCREHNGNAALWSDPVPLVHGPRYAPELAVSANGVAPLNQDAERAWQALADTCRRPGVAQRVDLRPGDALFINNRKGLHSREPFHEDYAGAGRWLQRCYVRRSLWDLRHRATGTRRVHY